MKALDASNVGAASAIESLHLRSGLGGAPAAVLLGLALLLSGCCHLCPTLTCRPSVHLMLEDSRGRSIDRLEIGETLSVGLRGLEADRGYRVELSDDRGRLVSFYQLTSDAGGAIPPSPVWYHSGVVGCGRLEAQSPRPYRFRTFDEAREALAGRTLVLTLRDEGGAALARQRLPVTAEAGPRPQIYFSDAEGCLVNGFVAHEEALYLSGKNLPPGTGVQIFLVANRYGWRPGAALEDVRDAWREAAHVLRLEEGKTSFTEPLWAAGETRPGAYDAVVRIDREDRSPRLRAEDVVTYVQDTGAVVQKLSFEPPWAPGDFDVAGRPDRNFGYPYFEFHDTFEVGEAMWGAVDPAMVPASHKGGDYAAFYVVKHGTAAKGLVDESKPLDVVPVKGTCINAGMTPIWNKAQAGEYDVVVDFGATTASTSSGWKSDGKFDPGKDFIDRSTAVGAYVVNDPSLAGPYTLATHTYEPASAAASDPLRTDVTKYFNTPDSKVTDKMDRVPLRGTGHSPKGSGPFPLVLVVHGNHRANHKSHTGYGYLTKLLASHGMIAVSVDENFLNGNVKGEMDARAVVLLRHLQRWRKWNATSGHPFHQKVNLDQIGLVGHSRGGEAITVARLFNKTLHKPGDPEHDFNFKIGALLAIAPVDGQIDLEYPKSSPIVLDGVDYLILHGSHDGDVFDFQGQQTFDRAFPKEASTTAASKGLLFVHGANHSYWNTEWASHLNDASSITSPLGQLGTTGQQVIAKVYVSGFFQQTLLDRKAYTALTSGDVSFGAIPSGVTLVHQYGHSQRIDLNNYEEDHSSATGSYAGVKNTATGLSPFLDQDLTGTWSYAWGKCSLSNPYYTWNQTSGLIAGWSSTSATYEIDLPSTLGTLVDTYPYLALRIGQIYESPLKLNPAGASQDLSLQLQLGSQASHWLKVSNFDPLPSPVETHKQFPWNLAYLGCTGQKRDVTKSVARTLRIPLRSFVVNRSDWPLKNVSKIRLKFNRLGSGLVVVDDVQLTK